MKTKSLILPVKKIYFEQIRDGMKQVEYRLQTPYWTKRIIARWYDQVIITLGYPSKDDQERRLVFPWRGYQKQTIVHEHFGKEPVDVFAIWVKK